MALWNLGLRTGESLCRRTVQPGLATGNGSSAPRKNRCAHKRIARRTTKGGSASFVGLTDALTNCNGLVFP
jgi:hypothetical protein